MYQTTNSPDTASHWYAVYCKPLKEWQAAVVLENHLKLAVFLPEVRRRSHQPAQRVLLFPRYLFLQADLQIVTLSKINATPGVLSLVAFGATPQPVPAAVIQALRQRVDRINEQGGLPEQQFHPGETVRLKQGPLRGLEAIFVGPMQPSERVRVLIDFLGQLREAEVGREILERTGSAPAQVLERRTRGKGRSIKR